MTSLGGRSVGCDVTRRLWSEDAPLPVTAPVSASRRSVSEKRRWPSAPRPSCRRTRHRAVHFFYIQTGGVILPFT